MKATPTLGLVLAGGLARRMGGGDKARVRIGGATILERVLARLKPQCPQIIINANGDPQRFASFGLPVIADSVKDFPGPLAGILAAYKLSLSLSPAGALSDPGNPSRHARQPHAAAPAARSIKRNLFSRIQDPALRLLIHEKQSDNQTDGCSNSALDVIH